MSAASIASSAGAIASTARDLAVWARALYGGELLSPESVREMTTFLPEGTYGLGTDVAFFAGKRAVGHRGGLRGFESSMWYFPSEDVSVVLLSNQGNWITDTPFERIASAVFRGR
jgi:CubicO group peptidase (beta-lactamase class C family)